MWTTQQVHNTCQSSPRTIDVPKGGVHDEKIFPEDNSQPQETNRCKRMKTRKIAGKVVKQRVKKKLDFCTVRQAARTANKTDQPMFLCVIKANTDPKTCWTKSRSKAGAAKGLTEGEKRRIAKETGPITKEVPIDETIKNKVAEADQSVREQLQQTLKEFKDVFPAQLPYGTPPKRVTDHEIETTPGATPPHKSSYQLSVAEQDELRRQLDTLLEQGWIRPSSSPYGSPILFIPKK